MPALVESSTVRSARQAAAPQPADHATAVVGADLKVPLVNGEWVGYANFDYAASAPALEAVREAVEAALPWYASVHRGAGFASQVSTRVYGRARAVVAGFLGCRADDAVIFTRNTTDGLNLLARALPDGCTVVVFDAEHHANLLPWDAAARTVRLPLPDSPRAAVEAAADALRSAPAGPRLLCVTGASNVTGELWPVQELTEVAHAYGARIAVDAAQLVPHRRVDLAGTGIDYLAFSGHKLYAPFGAGVLAGRADWLAAADPYLHGGGATRSVTRTAPSAGGAGASHAAGVGATPAAGAGAIPAAEAGATPAAGADATLAAEVEAGALPAAEAGAGGRLGVEWAADPEARHEAGSPNVLGAVAIAAACTALQRDFAELRAAEGRLLRSLREGLATVPGLRELRLFGPDAARVGIVAFTLDGWEAGRLAAVLSAEYGIGVRDGLFCAHPLTRGLLPEGTGAAVRASLGAGTRPEHVARLVSALRRLATTAPDWDYAVIDGRWTPIPDPRPNPATTAI
ncbi:MAG: aminotransferase class V-fold PLP-dependent enzyme [Streptosporangiales bacterium]|nr:aminotransferase class V-fold PLP-dependent enzyme [Streptosporangiales bacterium]